MPKCDVLKLVGYHRQGQRLEIVIAEEMPMKPITALDGYQRNADADLYVVAHQGPFNDHRLLLVRGQFLKHLAQMLP